MNQLHPIPAFSDNYIWTLSRDRQCLVVDPGESAPVEAWLAETGLALNTILITHHHFDHTGGLADLLQNHNPVVYGPASEKIDHLNHRLAEGDCISVLGTEWRVLDVPGHTSGHIAYYSAQDEVLFCGDTLFSGGCGRLFEGTATQMSASLNKFATLPGDTRACPAHEYTLANLAFADAVEPDNSDLQQYLKQCEQLREKDQPTLPSSIEQELKINPFMRTDQDSVIHAARAHSGTECAEPAEVLAVIRNWKDNF